MDTEPHAVSARPAGNAVDPRSRLRIFLTVFIFLLVVIAAAAIAEHSIQNFHQNDLREKVTRDLTQKAQAFATRVNSDRSTKIGDLTSQAAQQAGARATVVDGNGDVLADSQVPLAALEKEGAQPEFSAALRGNVGVRTRSRKPYGLPVLYVAVPVPGGAVRLSTPLAELETARVQANSLMFWGCGIAAAIALLVSAAIAHVTARD